MCVCCDRRMLQGSRSLHRLYSCSLGAYQRQLDAMPTVRGSGSSPKRDKRAHIVQDLLIRQQAHTLGCRALKPALFPHPFPASPDMEVISDAEGAKIVIATVAKANDQQPRLYVHASGDLCLSCWVGLSRWRTCLSGSGKVHPRFSQRSHCWSTRFRPVPGNHRRTRCSEVTAEVVGFRRSCQ